MLLKILNSNEKFIEEQIWQIIDSKKNSQNQKIKLLFEEGRRVLKNITFIDKNEIKDLS